MCLNTLEMFLFEDCQKLGQILLDFVWEHFFHKADEHKYIVYIHARSEYVYLKNTTTCSTFINRQLKRPVQGEASMPQSERLLMEEALQDPLNKRFILLSDKCWFVLIRKHVVTVVKDLGVFLVFQRYCKKMALPEFSESTKQNNLIHNCIFDEHYLQTLLIQGMTYSQRPTAHQHTMDRRGWHPFHSMPQKLPLKLSKLFRVVEPYQDINETHFVATSRREQCSNNSKALPCYLLAKNFT
uniref:Uncharacterized protein n=1 Tax=Physcomitrium patens TaxID=3218 RepID=A0A2K1K6T2_PHYPA|nr:hypothetical protein PHYPA_011382 [Physcomitrium patens]